MNSDYYFYTIMCLIAKYPEFQNKVANTCPTRWLDGTVCPPADDTRNKAFMETEMLMELELI